MSHTIGFVCHGLAKQWNGHWAYSDPAWKIIRGRRPYLLNREPYSTHVDIMEKYNCRILCDQRVEDWTGLKRNQLAPRFRQMSDQSLTTSGVYFLAVKN